MNKNLRNSILFRSDNKLKLYQEGKKLQVTRSAVAVNPLTCYNVSTGNVMEQFANNVLTKHGDYGFIGGDTLEVTFDFGTKVAGSVVECPLKISLGRDVDLANLPSPIDAGWSDEVNQAALDYIKTIDSNNKNSSTTTTTKARAFLLELDLTPLCNQLYGGSNAALKAALKSIQADIWAMGSGSNASVLTNQVVIKAFVGQDGNWSKNTAWGDSENYFGSLVGGNTSGAISKVTINSASFAAMINSSNKLYFLIHARYPSDGTIPSSVSLDYAKITIQLNRTVDVVAPKSVYLPKYWAMVIKGFSPSWAYDTANNGKRMFLLKKDANNSLAPYYAASNDTFSISQTINGSTSFLPLSTARTFKQYQTINLLLECNASGLVSRVLQNNDIVSKVTNANIDFYGKADLYVGSDVTNSQSDSFAESLQLYDLQSLGKPNGLSDAEAEVILRGIQYPSTSEMVVNGDFSSDTAWTKHANAVISGGVLTLNATAAWQETKSTSIPVIPNSVYSLIANITASQGLAQITVYEYNSSMVLVANSKYMTTATSQPYNFTTNASTAFVQLYCGNSAIGTFTFDNISLKYVKPSGQLITAVNKELFDINAVTLHANAVRSNGVITLNATSVPQVCSLQVSALPNNKYELNSVVTGSDAVISVVENYNNIKLKETYSMQGLNKTLITTANTNKIELRFWNSTTTGVKTWSDISLKLKQ